MTVLRRRCLRHDLSKNHPRTIIMIKRGIIKKMELMKRAGKVRWRILFQVETEHPKPVVSEMIFSKEAMMRPLAKT